MNTTEMIDEITKRTFSTRTRLNRRQVGLVLDLLADVIAEELAQPNGRVNLREVGTLTAGTALVKGGKLRAGEKLVTVEAKHVQRVRFKIAQGLKDKLSEVQHGQ